VKDAVISLCNVSYSYNAGTPIEKRALDKVDLKIYHGETVGIIGPTGSGKTTLCKIMAGLTPPMSGSVITPGLGLKNVGLVFQFPEHQIFCSSVFKDITYPVREISKLPRAGVEKAYLAACGQVGLDAEKVRDINPLELSSGEKRRVAIAGALVLDPQVLIFDEPTSGLDQKGKDALLGEIKRLSFDSKTIIIISHYIEELLNITDRMILMEGGRISADGKVKELLNTISANDDRIAMLPHITELMVRLKRDGLDVRTDICDPEEALMEIKKALNR